MGDIWRPSDSGIGDPYPCIFIQCVNGRERMAHKLWSHGLYGLVRNVYPTGRVEIPTGTVREFITEYLTPDGWKNKIIGQRSVNGSIKFNGVPEIWGIILPYIANNSLPDAIRGWE